MRILIIIALFLSACSNPSNSDKSPDPQIVYLDETQSPSSTPDFTGQWRNFRYTKSPRMVPEGIEFELKADKSFVAYRYFLKTGTTAYALVEYTGSYEIINELGKYYIKMEYDLPTCMGGSISNMEVITNPDTNLQLGVDFYGNGIETKFMRGSSMSEVNAAKPIKTSDCKYAKLSTDRRLPASN